MLYIFIFLVTHWYLSLFSQTFFLHRYSSHGMFKLSHFWERFFYLFSFFSQGPGYVNPKGYSILHQMHHRYSDQAKDPHSPQNYKNMVQIMWGAYSKYQLAKKMSPLDTESFIQNIYPQWPTFDHFIAKYKYFFKAGWGFFYLYIYTLINPPWYGYLFFPLHFMMGPIQGSIVNWFGHKRGYRNFNLDDHSKNSLPQDFFLMGELYQNNHHHFPSKANFSYKWFEIDFTFLIIIFLEKLKIVQFNKV